MRWERTIDGEHLLEIGETSLVVADMVPRGFMVELHVGSERMMLVAGFDSVQLAKEGALSALADLLEKLDALLDAAVDAT
jgi:hypothetical protein